MDALELRLFADPWGEHYRSSVQEYGTVKAEDDPRSPLGVQIVVVRG